MDKEIKFFVKRIFVKDISFESPEAPGIFGNIKSSPKIGFNLDDKIEKIDDDTVYFIINTLNQLNVDLIRNKLLLKVLPLKV